MKRWLMLLGLLTCFACGRGYSEGSRTGTLYKISHKGMVWKSWEGELNLGGLRPSDHGAIANTWNFTVVDPHVAASAEKLEGKLVRVQYVQWIQSGCSMDTDYEVTGITEVK